MSVEVHRALMDGLHASRFFERFEGLLAAPHRAFDKPVGWAFRSPVALEPSPTRSPRDDEVCPSCAARFASKVRRDAGPVRCARCGVTLGGSASDGATWWAYPLAPDVAPPAERSNETLATAATVGAELEPAPPPDIAIAGRYQLVGQLGRGGMGVVYQAWDPELERTVALKVLTAGRFAAPDARARFLAEARTAAAVRHRGIVQIFDVGSHDGRPYFTMEEVRGPSLDDVVKTLSPVPLDEAARIVEVVARAVQHAHDNRIAHRDLKPANVLLDTNGRPQVTDFGIAKALGASQDLTATRDLLGTPSYMAPEVARGDPDVDWVAADVYGIGAVLYAALAGAAPIAGSQTLSRILEAASAGRVAPVRSLRRDVPAPLAAIVHKALHVEPRRRYGTAAELAADLGRWRAGEAVLARPEGPVEKAARFVRRRWRPLALAAAVVLVVGASLTVPWALERAELQAREDAADQAWQVVRAQVDSLVEAGDDAAAHAAIRRFVDAPEHRGTHAVFRASMTLGALIEPYPTAFRAVPDEAPLDAFARALQDAPDESARAEALIRIARWLADNRRYVDMKPLLERLATSPEAARLEREILPLRVVWAIRAAHHDEAIEAWERARDLGLPIARRYAHPERIYGTLSVGRTLSEHPGELRDRRYDWTSGDVDGDGIVESYLPAYGTGVKRRVDGVETALGPGAGVPLTGDVVDLDVADLDGDGSLELVVSGAEWHTNDVRVLEADGAGGLRLRARDHRNSTRSVVAHPDPWRPGEQLVVSLETHDYPNRRVNGEDAAGPAGGVVVRRLVGDRLERIWHTRGDYTTLLSVDLDGDGQREVFVGGGVGPNIYGYEAGGAVLWAGEQPDTFELSVLPNADGVYLTRTGDDGDPGRLLLVLADGADEEFWIHRDGTDPLPRPQPAEPRGTGLPFVADAPTSDAWTTLEAVARAGLLRQAAEGFERLSGTSERGMATAGARQAAMTWQALDRGDRAAVAWERAATLGTSSTVDDDWEAAVRSWLDAAAPDRALEAAERWTTATGKGPNGLLAEHLDRWSDSRALRRSLADGLFDHARIVDPISVSVRPEVLEVDSVSGAGSLATVPFQQRGPVYAKAEIVIDEAEWASNLGIRVDAGARSMGASAGAVGGGRSHYWIFPCNNEAARADPWSGSGPLTLPATLRVRITWTPWDDRWTCVAEHLEREHSMRLVLDANTAEAEQDWSLDVDAGASTGRTWMSGEVRELELWGAELDPLSDPGDRARLALAEDEAGRALPGLAGDGPLFRASAHLQLADFEAASAALREADESGLLADHALILMLRGQRTTWARIVRSALGPERFLALFQETWHWTTVHDDHVRRALIEDLQGLDLSDRPELAARRATALLMEGDLDKGRAAADAFFARWEPSPSDPVSDDASLLQRTLAIVAAEEGDRDRATRHAQESIRVARHPWVALDRVGIEPSLTDIEVEPPSR